MNKDWIKDLYQIRDADPNFSSTSIKKKVRKLIAQLKEEDICGLSDKDIIILGEATYRTRSRTNFYSYEIIGKYLQSRNQK